ncbi:AraC family transcriptional regulator [Roseibium aestuarii]|uniref:AraC family transcriptional regulator n=1 Tax=Roseibium aestuarii TaxID=2600299 RepID=A0ABW4JWU7_9HYPH|nr:helix-turn-helix transcriptional regulator [Roseibium aestuarii]
MSLPSPAIHPDHFQRTLRRADMPVQAYSASGGPGDLTDWHDHPTAQLFHVIRGSLAVDIAEGTFFVPPERAVWLPGGIRHRTRYLTETEVRYMYFGAAMQVSLPEDPRVMQVTPLLRELILAFMAHPRRDRLEGPQARLADVILDQLKLLPASPLQLPMPADPRLKRLCADLAQAPQSPPRLEQAAQACGWSVRSFERRMQAETGLTYRAWCRQMKLFRALELLSAGQPVSDVSHALGYEGPSAFIASFRKAFGVTPGRYFGSP